MYIELDDLAKKWIESKGELLTVKTIEVKACCAPGVQELLAVPGKPKDIERYHEFKVDNLSIYVQNHLRVREKLTLKLSGFSFLKSISAELR